MSFDYAASAETALRLISTFGRACILKRQTASVYDKSTGTATSSGAAESGQAAVVPYAPHVVHNSGGVIKQEDQRALLAPAGVGQPNPGDQLTVGNVTYTIVSVNTIAPAGVAVLHDLQVRR